MRKFGDLYKEKAQDMRILHESKILKDFKKIYDTMLTHYGLTSVHKLNESSQVSFLTELNNYWNEEQGLTKRGKLFLSKRSMSLNENSTVVQRKNFLKNKSAAVINETIRQSDLKYKIYDVLDKMFKETESSKITEVLSPTAITNILYETLNTSVTNLVKTIKTELVNSSKD